MAELSLRGISKSYGATSVMEGLSLDVNDGEFIVLVGPSHYERFEGVAIISLPDDLSRFEPPHVEIAQGVAQQAAGIINQLRVTDAERLARQNTEMLLELARKTESYDELP